MKLGSLFDGAGTCPYAASLCGIKPVWASEIEPFPIAVSSSNFPSMIHLGDITGVHGDQIEPVDIITFGSPCQDLSQAGKRAGLDGSRSGLFMEAVRIFKEMRSATNGRYPKIVIWENVPGAFSSNKGEDFRTVLQELCGIKDPSLFIPGPPSRGGESDGPIAERSWQTSFPLRGESWTPEVGEFPKDAVESSLSSILMDNPPEKYRLSARACVGILRRSEKRGKPLPPLLKEVLERQAGLSPTPSKSEADVLGGKGALIQEDLSATLATNNDQYLFQPLSPPPAYGFKAGQSVKARGIGWEEETSQTLGASMSGIEPTVCCPMPLQSKTIPKTAE